jgi:hypothetical protein
MSDRDPYSPQNFYERTRRRRLEISLDHKHEFETWRAIADMKATDALVRASESSPAPTPTPPRVNEELVRKKAELLKRITEVTEHAFLLQARDWAKTLEAIDLSLIGAWQRVRDLARKVADFEIGPYGRQACLALSMRISLSDASLAKARKPTVPLDLFHLVVGLWELQDACRGDESQW